MEYFEAVGAAEFRLSSPFWMRHHTHDITARTADAGNVFHGDVGINCGGNFPSGGGIAKQNASIPVQLFQRRLIAKIVPFHVTDWDSQNVSLSAGVGEGSFRVLN